jgi:hypothetical protein
MNAVGLDAICTAAEELSRTLLRAGYFARGAITKGLLYHDHNMVFGPAFLEAYRLETTVSKFPRIMVPRSVAADGPVYAKMAHIGKINLGTVLSKHRTGPYFLHIFRNHARIARELAAKSPKAETKDPN